MPSSVFTTSAYRRRSIRRRRLGFTPNAATYIGADIDNGSTVADPFVGAIDEVRIYSRALLPTELVELATGDP